MRLRKVIKTTALLAVCILLNVACTNKKRAQTDIADSVQIERLPYLLNMEECLTTNNAADTFVINSISSSIEVIPLETDEKALLSLSNFRFINHKDKFVLSSGLFNTSTGIFLFNGDGKYIKKIITVGRGPNEVGPTLFSFNINENDELVVCASDKMIFYSFDDDGKRECRLGKHFGHNIVSLNDGNYAALDNTMGSGSKDVPYLSIIDGNGVICNTFSYQTDRKIHYDIGEGSYNGPNETYGLFPSSDGGALFHDMFNDTLYHVSAQNLAPYLILQRGKSAPDVNANNIDAKAKGVYVKNVAESLDYLFIEYLHNNNVCNLIWDKTTRTTVSKMEVDMYENNPLVVNFGNYTRYRTANGENILVGILCVQNDTVYCIVNPFDAIRFIPDYREDDNPVVLKVKLK